MIIFNIYNVSNDLFANLFIVSLIRSYNIVVINILINYIIHIRILFNRFHFFNGMNLQLTEFPYIHN